MKRYSIAISLSLINTILMCCILSIGNSEGQPNTYFATDRIQLEGRPGSVAAFDLNGNGYKDLIVTDQEAGNVIILLGNGQGGFHRAEGTPFPAGKEPEDVAIGDFNGDQKPDIAVANHDTDYITLLLGDGEGQFREALTSPIYVESNPHPHGIAAGDFNSDGNWDLVTESWQDNEVVVLLGDGKGAFLAQHSRYGVGQLPYYKLRVGDLNKDRYTDIITSNWNGSSLSILLADSTGGFLPAVEMPTPSSPFSIAIGDLNKDGMADIGVAHRLGNSARTDADGVSILLGNGQGGFENASDIPFSSGKTPTSVAIGDFNGDDVDDMAVANYGSGDVTVILGSQAGFQQASGSPFKVGEGPISVTLVDLNGDDKADIVTANSVSKDISVVFAPE